MPKSFRNRHKRGRTPSSSDVATHARGSEPKKIQNSLIRSREMTTKENLSIVPIADDQTRNQAFDLLVEYFQVPQRIWVKALDALPGRERSGFLLIENGVAHGVLLTFEHSREVSGKIRRFINLSSWYVRESHRAYSYWMFRTAIAEKNVIYTSVTPGPLPFKISVASGFRIISNGSILSAPMLNGLGLGRGIRVEAYEGSATNHLDGKVLKWLEDHSNDLHIIVLVSGLGATFPVVFRKTRGYRGLRYARLSYTGSHELVRAALPALHWHLLIHKAIVGIQLPCIEPYRDLRSVIAPTRGPSILVKGDIPEGDVDLLYTEMLYVPSLRM
jgi:hypothetical protein